ncbi:NmrA family NAD(P)-binding protein [Nocardia sp. NBC_01327]|uniref:NmrA family NAD(P)-binding protein n=1 Tax=Nocardia sp. NBC_01327 TaxID=2903593 RepID=UPI002E168349|nr:NmrA family NAD(P)-binding protein [Nocardia sp. NBC_01327]
MTSIHDSESTVLVIGAGGRHGRTGSRVVEQLRERGRGVRVLLRADDGRAQRLRQDGVGVVIGDLQDRRTLDAAVDGVDAVYFAYPVGPGVVSAAANLASALRRSDRTPHLVVMSMAASAAESPSGLGRAQWAAEEVFTWAGLEPTVLRVAALFYENILLLHAAEIRRTGRIANSFGNGTVPWISGRDAADLAAAALTDTDRFPKGSTLYPQAPVALSHNAIAEMIATETGRPIRYEHISREQWQSELEDLARADASATINIPMAQHISAIGETIAQLGPSARSAPNPAALTQAIGHEPLSFPEFIESHRDQFTTVS